MTLGSSTQHLNHIFSRFLYSAHKLKIPIADIKNVMRDWLNAPTTTRFLFIEPREYLREIVLAEIEQALTLPASACSSDDPELKDKLIGAIVLVLPTNAAMIRTLLPSEAELITLQIRSAAGALAKKLPVPPDAIVGIASAWPQFLDTTRTMLIAAGIAPDALTVRNTKEPHWQDGLDQAAGVVCDVLTATRLPRTVRPIPFPVLSETAIEELKNRADVMMFARRI
jgi:hypothetical protein